KQGEKLGMKAKTTINRFDYSINYDPTAAGIGKEVGLVIHLQFAKQYNKLDMKNSARAIVEKMFTAFSSGDADAFVATVSEDTVWVYHGTQIIPAGTFEKKEGVRTFFTNIMERTEIINFEPQQYI